MYPVLYKADAIPANHTVNGNPNAGLPTHRGLGSLSDCLSCEVTEERNGAFEVSIVYPANGIHYNEIAEGMLIKAKPNDIDDPQFFRIYGISKPFNNKVEILGEHISYDLNNYPITPEIPGWVLSGSPSTLWGYFANGQQLIEPHYTPPVAMNNAFVFSSVFLTMKDIHVEEVRTMRDLLGGNEDSFLDLWQGEYKFDNFIVTLYEHRGSNRGVTVKYGKNMTDLTQDISIENMYTHILPFAKKTEYVDVGIAVSKYDKGDVDGDAYITTKDAELISKYVTHQITLTGDALAAADYNNDSTVDMQDAHDILSAISTAKADRSIATRERESWVYATKAASSSTYGNWDANGVLALKDGNGVLLESKYGFKRVKILDLTDVFDSDYNTQPADVKEQCENYISTNTEIRRPKVTLTVKFQPQIVEGDNNTLSNLEKVCLCDTVRVVYPLYGIDELLKVNKTVYNGLTERYKSIEIGDAKSNFADTIRNET